jgi:hypothetical protein
MFGWATNHLDCRVLEGIKSYTSQNLTQSWWEEDLPNRPLAWYLKFAVGCLMLYKLWNAYFVSLKITCILLIAWNQRSSHISDIYSRRVPIFPSIGFSYKYFSFSFIGFIPVQALYCTFLIFSNLFAHQMIWHSKQVFLMKQEGSPTGYINKNKEYVQTGKTKENRLC